MSSVACRPLTRVWDDYEDRAIARFFAKVNKADNGCWEYIGYTKPTGYGQFQYRNVPHQAHRIAYLFCVADLAFGECALHRCDNKKCVNPKHLFVGNNHDNMRDMIAKHGHPRGNFKHGRYARA